MFVAHLLRSYDVTLVRYCEYARLPFRLVSLTLNVQHLYEL